jgi:hypothetical protein
VEQPVINILVPVSILETAGKVKVGGFDAEAKGGRLLKDKQASPLLTRWSRTFSLPSLLLQGPLPSERTVTASGTAAAATGYRDTASS